MAKTPLKGLGRIIGWVLLALATFVITATFRLYSDGRRHLQEAMRRLNAGDSRMAVAEFEDAAKAYLPGSPYPKRALRELAILAKSAEMRGDPILAATIWEAARRAILATRHVFQPHESELLAAEKEIVNLRSDQNSNSVQKAKLIARPSDPPFVASLLLFFGLLSWMLGAILLLVLGHRRKADHEHRLKAAWAASLGGLGLWLTMAYWVG